MQLLRTVIAPTWLLRIFSALLSWLLRWYKDLHTCTCVHNSLSYLLLVPTHCCGRTGQLLSNHLAVETDRNARCFDRKGLTFLSVSTATWLLSNCPVLPTYAAAVSLYQIIDCCGAVTWKWPTCMGIYHWNTPSVSAFSPQSSDPRGTLLRLHFMHFVSTMYVKMHTLQVIWQCGQCEE